MTWNYRVIAFVEIDEVVLQICRVQYDEDNEPVGYADPSITLSTAGMKGLRWILSKQRDALKLPILYGGERFPEEFIEKK